MNESHLVFIIARVPRHGGTLRYRCVAAYSHISYPLAKSQPLRAAKRCLVSFRQPQNAAVVREELLGLNGKYGSGGQQPGTSSFPCPFTLGLLSMSWDADPTPEAMLAGPAGLPFEHNVRSADLGGKPLGYDELGVTVIDITDPGSPAYCFLTSTSGRPLTGIEYLVERGYLDKAAQGAVPEPQELTSRSLPENITLQDLTDLSDERLVTLDALADASPEEYAWHQAIMRHNSEQADDHTREIQSLAQLSLRAAIAHALHENGTNSLEETILWLPGKADLIIQLLREISPVPDTAAPLLREVVKFKLSESTSLDLSGLDLSDAQLVEALQGTTNLSVLNVSRQPRLTAPGILHLLAQHPSLRRLVIMNCAGIESEELTQLLADHPQAFYNLEALMHPIIFRYNRRASRSPWCMAISFVFHYGRDPTMRGISLPLLSPAAVVQGIIDLLTATQRTTTAEAFDEVCAATIAPAFASAPRADNVPWDERSIVAFPRLQTTLIDPEKGGWVFVLDTTLQHEHRRPFWAFLKFAARTGDHGCEVPLERRGRHVYGLRGFLELMRLDGRPMPSAANVDRAQNLVQSLESDQPGNVRPFEAPLKLEAESYPVTRFLKMVDRRNAFL